jgi:aminoglycoside phosphotransferase (APT) family kinase protein
LWKLFGRKVTLHQGTVTKSGKRIRLEEADALRIAEKAGIPVPHVLNTQQVKGRSFIHMTYIEGQTLETKWPDMSSDEKSRVAYQLRDIVDQMRSIKPPTDYIGGCGGANITDARDYTTYSVPACTGEDGFNQYLASSLFERIPPPIKKAMLDRLQKDMAGHKIMFSHCDLAPRNIIVKDGNIVGLIDWELAGWYPEYWEYVKFFQRGSGVGDWRDFADIIFSHAYPDELVDYTAICRWQRP